MFCVRTGNLLKTIDEDVIGETITAGKKSNVYTFPHVYIDFSSISRVENGHAIIVYNVYNIITRLYYYKGTLKILVRMQLFRHQYTSCKPAIL